MSMIFPFSYIYVCTCVCTHIHICTYIHTYTNIYTHIYVCISFVSYCCCCCQKLMVLWGSRVGNIFSNIMWSLWEYCLVYPLFPSSNTHHRKVFPSMHSIHVASYVNSEYEWNKSYAIIPTCYIKANWAHRLTWREGGWIIFKLITGHCPSSKFAYIKMVRFIINFLNFLFFLVELVYTTTVWIGENKFSFTYI